MSEIPESIAPPEFAEALPVHELEDPPTSQSILAVMVRARDPNHTHNGKPTHGQPFPATPEAANELLRQNLATLEE